MTLGLCPWERAQNFRHFRCMNSFWDGLEPELWPFLCFHTFSCIFALFSLHFPFISLLFEVQWLWDYVHENERKISFRMVLRIPSGMVWSLSYDQFYVSLCASLLSTLFRPFWDPPWSIFNHQGKFWAHTPLVVSPAGSSSLPNSFHPYNFWALRGFAFLLNQISIDFPISLDFQMKNLGKSIGKAGNLVRHQPWLEHSFFP